MTEQVLFYDDYRLYLSEAFETRRLRNPNYSMRAFARDLGLAVSTLIEVQKGKYGLSAARAREVATKLNLSQRQCEHFSDLLTAQFARSNEQRVMARKAIEHRINNFVQEVSLDSFKIISEWHHLAFLELMDLEKNHLDKARYAKKLGVSEKVIEDSLDRMSRLGLIEITANSVKPTSQFTSVNNNYNSEAVRGFHKQIIEKALYAVERQDNEKREVSSTLFSIKKQDFPAARKALMDFRREFASRFGTTENADDVCCLSIQFFSLLAQEDAR
ncbi:hypothetical protein AZI87_17495 [Bdellovibrio bacteriovorus]|uniref:DUF4423 domain-containing protein n=1 Tax=Bdellovibrio bacteriovorus TaxID=959 RepID=A0A162FUF8_BDEBC|nr:TIGR02147 family protein [Bdellovibrio bacteriovorus]KYG62318.1 hypothetical protein AZI87_17495 [Bdellovibrio bacteriovorus]